jgi:metallo-beta-lactamase family protein
MSLRLTFHGAAGTVTGSCFALDTGSARILVDCGLFQGSKSERELNYGPFPFAPSEIDALILTHAHIDHSGLVPKLTRLGFDGPVHATRGTADLASVMLLDSGHIQETEVEQLNRRNARRRREPVEPIYTVVDALNALKQFHAHPYGRWFAVGGGARARFWNAAHLLGSASVEIEVPDGDGGDPVRILFSGDIGPGNKLLHREPEAPSAVDYVVCEATYGDVDRVDATHERRRQLLRDEVKAAIRPNGTLLIPSFAVERTQELLVDLIGLMEAGELPTVPVYIDSPLASKASVIFAAHARELENGADLVRALEASNVHVTESVEESKALDRLDAFHIVIAASGMCDAGRIRHRLKNWLWRPEATVLLVGFQAQGSLGRVLLDGAAKVRIHGEEIAVRAAIRSIDLYSGHADGPQLAAWLEKRLPIRRGLFLVHGEAPALEGLRARASGFLPQGRIFVPGIDAAFELSGAAPMEIAPAAARRIEPDEVGRFDWHNDLSRLILDIGDAVGAAADARARGVVIRRLRRALEEGER